MDSPLGIILEMILTVISNTINTLVMVFNLFINLIESLGFVTKIGGLPLFIASIIIISFMIYLLGKFFFSAGKQIIILFIVGVIIVWIVILSIA